MERRPRANEVAFLVNVNTFIIQRESRHLKDLVERYNNQAFNGMDGMASHTLQQIRDENIRTMPQGKFDHEEVYIGTGKYTNGRVGG
jgi:hypothetical protein